MLFIRQLKIKVCLDSNKVLMLIFKIIQVSIYSFQIIYTMIDTVSLHWGF